MLGAAENKGDDLDYTHTYGYKPSLQFIAEIVGKYPQFLLPPEKSKSWNIHPISQLFKELPKGQAS